MKLTSTDLRDIAAYIDALEDASEPASIKIAEPILLDLPGIDVFITVEPTYDDDEEFAGYVMTR
jgi:hypothetical protein